MGQRVAHVQRRAHQHDRHRGPCWTASAPAASYTVNSWPPATPGPLADRQRGKHLRYRTRRAILDTSPPPSTSTPGGAQFPHPQRPKEHLLRRLHAHPARLTSTQTISRRPGPARSRESRSANSRPPPNPSSRASISTPTPLAVFLRDPQRHHGLQHRRSRLRGDPERLDYELNRPACQRSSSPRAHAVQHQRRWQNAGIFMFAKDKAVSFSNMAAFDHRLHRFGRCRQCHHRHCRRGQPVECADH